MSAPEGPAARLVAAAVMVSDVQDAHGRKLSLRRLTALDKLRLFKAAGPALSQNQMWLGMAVVACSVTAVDDVPVPYPTNEAQIEALVARLEDAGIAAVGMALGQMTPPLDVAAAKN